MLPFHIDLACFESGFFARDFFLLADLAIDTPPADRQANENNRKACTSARRAGVHQNLGRLLSLLQRSDINE
jgi:hypothetical protein